MADDGQFFTKILVNVYKNLISFFYALDVIYFNHNSQ